MRLLGLIAAEIMAGIIAGGLGLPSHVSPIQPGVNNGRLYTL
jgi:hypothetical protein